MCVVERGGGGRGGGQGVLGSDASVGPGEGGRVFVSDVCVCAFWNGGGGRRRGGRGGRGYWQVICV